jgi:hypothetical protein
MLRLVMTLSAGYQGRIVPMRLGSTVIKGTRAGGGPPGGPPLAVTVDRVALYHGANHRQTVVPFISTATVPGQWCTSYGQPAGRDPLTPRPPNEFRMIKPTEETSHREHVRDRRSQADGDRLMVGSLRRRDHPEGFRDVWTAGPSPRRKA